MKVIDIFSSTVDPKKAAQSLIDDGVVAFTIGASFIQQIYEDVFKELESRDFNSSIYQDHTMGMESGGIYYLWNVDAFESGDVVKKLVEFNYRRVISKS
jgi:hypothetical protein